MPALVLPDPPLGDGVVALRGFVQRPACDHLPDVFYARLRS